MTDVRQEFQKWWNIEKKNPIPDYGQESLTYDITFHGWKACQSLNDKRIADLLAVIEVQREYIKEIKDITLCTMTEDIAFEALAIKPENVEFVEVGKVKEVGGSLFACQYSPDNGVRVGDSVYTIKTKA